MLLLKTRLVYLVYLSVVMAVADILLIHLALVAVVVYAYYYCFNYIFFFKKNNISFLFSSTDYYYYYYYQIKALQIAFCQFNLRSSGSNK